MFDISFTELIVIAVVALVVIGPERLPRVARMAGHLLGRLQRYVADVKSDIQREMQLEELKKLQAEVAESARQMQQKIATDLHDVEQHLQSGMAEVKAAGDEVHQTLGDTAASVEQAGRRIAAAAEPGTPSGLPLPTESSSSLTATPVVAITATGNVGGEKQAVAEAGHADQQATVPPVHSPLPPAEPVTKA